MLMVNDKIILFPSPHLGVGGGSGRVGGGGMLKLQRGACFEMKSPHLGGGGGDVKATDS